MDRMTILPLAYVGPLEDTLAEFKKGLGHAGGRVCL